MSGPVFVLDAQGIPLMPMASAHARALLTRGTARHVPHHAFTIIQLSHSYIDPILRPILLHIKIESREILLLLLMDQQRGLTPLLMLLSERQRAGWHHHIHPYHGHAKEATTAYRVQQSPIRKKLVYWDHLAARRLSQLIAYLRTIVPLSHVIVQVDDPQQSIIPTLIADVTLANLQHTILSPFIHLQNVPQFLSASMKAVQHTNWRRIPLFYASVTDMSVRHNPHSTVSDLQTPRAVCSMFRLPHNMLVVCQDGQYKQIGLHLLRHKSHHPMVLIPSTIAPTHIVWNWNALPQNSRLWPLQTDGMVFIPMRRFTF